MKHSAFKKSVLTLVLGGLAFYLGLLTLLYINQRSMMYFPDTNPPRLSEYADTGIKPISVTTQDRLEISGLLVPSQTENSPLIVYFHGNALSHGSRLQKALRYTIHGYDVLLAGYRGYGGNPGSPSEQGLYKDGRAYMAWAKETYQGRSIFLHGESLGTGVAVQMASEFDTAGLVLEAPFSSTVDIAKDQFWFLPVSILMHDQYRSVNTIHMVEEPLFIVHGQRDHIVPFRYGQKLFEAANEPKSMLTIESAGHNNLYMYQETITGIREFLDKYTKQNQALSLSD